MKIENMDWIPIEKIPNSLNVILVSDGESVWIDQKLGVEEDAPNGDYYFNGHENWDEVIYGMLIPPLPTK